MNVPDLFDNLEELENKASILSPFQIELSANQIQAKAFMPSDMVSINVEISNGANIFEFNYAFIECKGDDVDDVLFSYFIEGIQFNNALSNYSVTLSLKRDIWCAYYNSLRRKVVAKIARKHRPLLRRLGDEYRFTHQQNFCNNSVSTVSEFSNNGGYKILWALYKLDPTIDYWDLTEENPIPGSYKIRGYGNLEYLFHPIAVVDNNAYRWDYNAIYLNNDEGINRFEPTTYLKIKTESIMSVETTMIPPFNYTVTPRDLDSYNLTIVGATSQIVGIKVGEGGSPDDFIEMGKFIAPPNRVDIWTENYENLDTPQRMGEGYLNEEIFSPFDDHWYRHKNTFVYPYRYYTLRRPDGTNVQIKATTPIKMIKTYIYPSDSGGSFWYEVIDNGDVTIIPRSSTYSNFERSAQMPLTVDAVLAYLQRSGNKNLVDYEFALDKNFIEMQKANEAEYRRQRDAIVGGTIDVAGGLAMAQVDPAKGTSSVVNGSRKLMSTGDVGPYILETKQLLREREYIKDSRNAFFEDLNNTSIMNMSTNSSINDKVFNDRFILYFCSFIPLEEYRDDVYDFILSGTQSFSVEDPFSNVNEYYDYVACSAVDLKTIANLEHRRILSIILLSGVRKFHMDKITTPELWKLDYFAENYQRSYDYE